MGNGLGKRWNFFGFLMYNHHNASRLPFALHFDTLNVTCILNKNEYTNRNIK